MVRYWVVRMTMESEQDDDLEDWEITKSNNFVGIGWSAMGDLTKFSKENIDRLKEKYENTYDEPPKKKV
jgi:hypothetical protein